MSWGSISRPSWWKELDCKTHEERLALAKRIAQRIEIMRLGKGVTKQQIGSLFSTRSTAGQKVYNALLKGKRVITRQQLYALADEFDIDTHDLVVEECPQSVYKYTTYAQSPAEFEALGLIMRSKIERSLGELREKPIDIWQRCGFKKYKMLLEFLQNKRRLQRHEFLGLCEYFVYDEIKTLREAGIPLQENP